MNTERLIANLLDRADAYNMQASNCQDTIDRRIAFTLEVHTRELAELIQDAVDHDE